MKQKHLHEFTDDELREELRRRRQKTPDGAAEEPVDGRVGRGSSLFAPGGAR